MDAAWTPVEVKALLMQRGFVAETTALWRRADGVSLELGEQVATLRYSDGRTSEVLTWATLMPRMLENHV